MTVFVQIFILCVLERTFLILDLFLLNACIMSLIIVVGGGVSIGNLRSATKTSVEILLFVL